MSMQRLVAIMERLRDPENGCPWDREQTLESIAPYTVEEVYEVVDSIAEGDMPGLCDELGDLLFHVVFYSQIAREQGVFDFDDVSRGICEKMIRRHPHVFADAEVADAAEQTREWERLKAAERAARPGGDGSGHLDGIARALPALVRANKLQKRAAKVGFDWEQPPAVLDKVREELDELERELSGSPVSERQVAEEMGDLLFSCVNLARHLGYDAESLLRDANGKFEKRFHRMEVLLRDQGVGLEQGDMSQMDRAWNRVKREERGE